MTIAVHVVPGTSCVGPLFQNIAIFSVLFLIWVRGAGTYTSDNREQKSLTAQNWPKQATLIHRIEKIWKATHNFQI